MSRDPATVRRLTAAAQGATGLALLARPDALINTVCGTGARPETWIVRLLGARTVIQAAVTAARPTRFIEVAGAGGDLAHAASMVWVARRVPRFGRPALASAAVAALFAGAALSTLRAGGAHR